jgi:hypothetical protein
MTMGALLPTFRRIVLAPSSSVKQSKKAALGMLDPEDGGIMIIEMASTGYPKRRSHILTSVRYSAQM